MAERQETHLDPIEQAQELIRQAKRHLEHEEFQSALAIFSELHPADQADMLAELDQDQRQELLKVLAPEKSAKILEHVEPERAAAVFGDVDASVLSDILDEARPEVAADLLKELPEEQSQKALEAMAEAEGVAPLLGYADDSAGGIMSPKYISVRDDMTAAVALDILRIQGPEAETIGSITIVDNDRKPVGSLSVTRLALARPNVLVGDITDHEFISVSAETDQEGCARLMGRYNLSHLPVVDRDGRLIGLILAEDIVDVAEEEATEDMYKVAGVGEERVFGPLRKSLFSRLPWLYVNLGTAFMAALVISLFESTISKVVALAIFLPVVAGQGGIGGTQTVTLVVRSMALGEVPGHQGLRLLVREVLLGLINGILLGVVVGLVAYAWKGNYMLGIVLGIAMLGNMLVAGLAGAGVPLLLRSLRLDPAVSSAVFVTTFTDVIGFLLFLGLAAAFIGFLT